jgi:hypothetical protein
MAHCAHAFWIQVNGALEVYNFLLNVVLYDPDLRMRIDKEMAKS